MLRLWRCAGEFGMSHRLILLLAVVQSAAAQNNDDRRHTSPSSAAIGFVVAAVFLFVLCCGIQRRRVQRANKPAYIAPPLPLHTNSHMHTGTPYAPGIHGMQYGQGGHSPYGHTPPLGGYPFNPNAPGPNAGSEYPPAAAADWAPPPYVKDAEGTEGPGEAGGQQYAPPPGPPPPGIDAVYAPPLGPPPQAHLSATSPPADFGAFNGGFRPPEGPPPPHVEGPPPHIDSSAAPPHSDSTAVNTAGSGTTTTAPPPAS